MRRHSVAIVVSLLLGLASLAFGQAKPSKVFQKGPFDDFAFSLLLRPDVQKELKIDSAQKGNFRGRGGRLATEPGQNRAVIVKVLKAPQLVRLQELVIQKFGPPILMHDEISAALGLTKDQIRKLFKTQEDVNIYTMDLGYDETRTPEERDRLAKRAVAGVGSKLLAILTPAQRKQFNTMRGKTFKFDPDPAPQGR